MKICVVVQELVQDCSCSWHARTAFWPCKTRENDILTWHNGCHSSILSPQGSTAPCEFLMNNDLKVHRWAMVSHLPMGPSSFIGKPIIRGQLRARCQRMRWTLWSARRVVVWETQSGWWFGTVYCTSSWHITHMLYIYTIHIWTTHILVGGLEHFPYIGKNNPKWLSYYSEG